MRRSSSMAALHVSPQVALVDDKVKVTSEGLGPTQKVTIHAFVEEPGAVFSSCAHFVSDENGHIDLMKHPSMGGTYTGVDSMGLFWSMRPAPGQPETSRLVKRDVTTPQIVHLQLLDDHVTFEALPVPPAAPVLASFTVERWYKHRDVERIEIRDGKLRGTLFVPKGAGPFPGVIDLYGSSGGLLEMRPAMLASRGIAALALGYFGYDDLPKRMDQLDVDYFLGAVDWLSSHPSIRPGGIGVVGFSKGGELGFLLGSISKKVKAVVNISGAPIFSFYDIQKGGKLYLSGVRFQPDKTSVVDGAMSTLEAFGDYINEAIPVWKQDAKVLYMVGGEDGTWDTEKVWIMKDKFPPEKRQNISIVHYKKTGHLIEPPYTPFCRMTYSKLVGGNLLWGGTPEPHAAAQEDSWRRLLQFLFKHLGDGTSVKSHL